MSSFITRQLLTQTSAQTGLRGRPKNGYVRTRGRGGLKRPIFCGRLLRTAPYPLANDATLQQWLFKLINGLQICDRQLKYDAHLLMMKLKPRYAAGARRDRHVRGPRVRARRSGELAVEVQQHRSRLDDQACRQ
jgi:hypothetical protein